MSGERGPGGGGEERSGGGHAPRVEEEEEEEASLSSFVLSAAVQCTASRSPDDALCGLALTVSSSA